MELQAQFENLGGQFFLSEEAWKAKLAKVKALVFDWDGVFNAGVKSQAAGSPFSEPDSMGLNMLRFSFWLQNGHLPFTAIISGENNQTALQFAQREHLDAVMLKAKNKGESLTLLLKQNQLKVEECLFVFDDILDLSAAKIATARIQVNRTANPLFSDFVDQHKLCDYRTAHAGDQHAVREISELLIGLNGNYAEVIEKRMAFEGDYQNYLNQRNAIEVEEWTIHS